MVPGLLAERFGWQEAKKAEGVGDLIRQMQQQAAIPTICGAESIRIPHGRKQREQRVCLTYYVQYEPDEEGNLWKKNNGYLWFERVVIHNLMKLKTIIFIDKSAMR